MSDSSMNCSATPARRSRNGCRECRRRHRRCNEAKPTCSYCESVSVECNYSRELSWGGRPFKKSRFGQCMGKDFGAVKIPSDSSKSSRNTYRKGRDSYGTQFVYMGVLNARPGSTCDYSDDRRTPEPKTNSPGSEREPATTPLDNIYEISRTDQEETVSFSSSLIAQQVENQHEVLPPTTSQLQILRPSSELSFLPTRAQALLEYFQYKVSGSICCHKGIQNDICSALIPMGLRNSHLMAAMLCASASHRFSAGLAQTLEDVIHLRSTAIRLLNAALTNPSQFDSTVAFATSIVLCISETMSSGSDGGWRIFLSGASALLERLGGLSWKQENSTNFIKRMYSSLRVIPTICGMEPGRQLIEGEPIPESDDYIDDYKGFSTGLIPIFQQIRGLEEASGIVVSQERNLLLEQRFQLIERVQEMLILRTPRFRPEVSALLSITTKTDFCLLDEAYHHMALLQLYKCEELKMSFIFPTQNAVERTILCIEAMNITASPCPGAAALPPLFVAGCAATNESDRVRIKRLLSHIQGCFGMGNVISSKRFLETCWNASNLEDILEGKDFGGVDFLPY